ncbi:signal peptidase II [Candidatus Falkowbacteria bacterium]|uniref:Lipoprotein signal peptidase n=1 Tax=Candidatus Buchananbacteria bacterium CG10_big_fil_rev_8_21_14_0_10_33_19 TaxID=1974525 RepID=A0A2H0W753_9BACT|nr:signal peptidase II [Candidatus Falkowbacteria bacterium]PIS06421.1 MAG: signal peptidase II [Candidatus Buchananbacteria bacterium CG10_big_fil_rev_8_21_14_0_10_33_19]
MLNIRYWAINIIVLNVLFLDILLKKIFFTNASEEYFIFGDILKLKLATNSGIAFGLGFNYYALILIYFLIIPVLFFALLKAYQQKNNFNILGFTLIILGAISNLIDRIIWREVIDYIDLKYYTVFNLADVMIVLGVILIMVNSFRKK